MSTPKSNPFGAFMPGWDFLQSLGKAMPAQGAPAQGWVAPTLSVEDLDKRIQELKAVQYWLEQNARMLTATIQALEVQKMTLSTLKTMNVHVDELAKAMKVKPEDFMTSWAQAKDPKEQAPPDAAQQTEESHPDARTKPSSGASRAGDREATASPDPMQWWGAVSQQFQDIAQSAATDWQRHALNAQAHLGAQPKQPAASKTKPKTKPKTAQKNTKTTRKSAGKPAAKSPAKPRQS